MVPVDLAVSTALGASVVLVNKSSAARQGPVRSTALGALFVLQLFISVPIAAFLLSRYPDWMLMYLWRPEDLAVPLWGWLALYPGSGMIGFYATRHLVRQGKALAAWGVLVGAVVLAIAILVLGFDHFSQVGTSASFQNDRPMQPLSESPLAYLLGASWIALAAGWSATMWRLTVYGRAMRLREGEVEATVVRDDEKSDTRKTAKKKK